MARIIGYAPAATDKYPSAVKYYVTCQRDNVVGLQAVEVWCPGVLIIGEKPAELQQEVELRFSYKYKHFYIKA